MFNADGQAAEDACELLRLSEWRCLMGANATSPRCSALLVRALCQAMAGDSRDLCGVENYLVIYSLFSLIHSFIYLFVRSS